MASDSKPESVMDLNPSVSIGNGIAHRERTNCNGNWKEVCEGNRSCSIASCRAIISNQLLRALFKRDGKFEDKSMIAQ